MTLFSDGYARLKDIKDGQNRRRQFKALVGKFAESAAKAAGGGVVTVFKLLLAMP